jgi:hypothetical protein
MCLCDPITLCVKIFSTHRVIGSHRHIGLFELFYKRKTRSDYTPGFQIYVVFIFSDTSLPSPVSPYVRCPGWPALRGLARSASAHPRW